MIEPSPFYVPHAPPADLDAFLAEVDRALEALVTADREELLLRRADLDEPLAA